MGKSLRAETSIIKEKAKKKDKGEQKYYFYNGHIRREPKSQILARREAGLLREYEGSWCSDYDSELRCWISRKGPESWNEEHVGKKEVVRLGQTSHQRGENR